METSDFVRMADQRLDTVREAVGDSVDIAVDFRGRVSRSVAKQLLSVLNQYELMFVEEPVLPEHNDVLSQIASSTQTPIATASTIRAITPLRPRSQ
jgi:galactonate dehydratase